MLNNVKLHIGETCIGVALLGLGIFAVVEGVQMPLGNVALPGAGFFPIALGVLLCITSLVIIFRRSTLTGEPVKLVHAKGLITLGGIAGVAALFEQIGAVPTVAIFFAALFYLLAKAPWWKAILMGVAGAALTWVLFVYLLGLPLPGA